MTIDYDIIRHDPLCEPESNTILQCCLHCVKASWYYL